MHVIIIGGGKIGLSIAKSLTNEGHDIVLVDESPDVLEEAVAAMDIKGVCGNGISYDVLDEAGAKKAYLIIATTESDEKNILACMVARHMGTHHSIARVRNPDYSRQLTFMRDELGLSMMVNPELAVANEISRMLRFPAATRVETFNRGRVELVEIALTAESTLVGKVLSSLYSHYKASVLVCAIRRGDEVIIPNGATVLQEGDVVYITASRAELSVFFKAIGLIHTRMKNVLIIGGGTIAHYLTQQLLDSGINVKIIETNRDRCVELSETFPKATIIHGDGADQDVLIAEGIAGMDACISLTGMDEENILISRFASLKNVPKVITKINREALIGILGSLGNESVVNPKQTTANLILQYVRAKQNTDGSNIRTLYRLVDEQVEALEFIVSGNSRALGIPLRDLSLRPEILVACIVRGNKVIVPGGNTVIQEKDSVIVVTAHQHLHDFEDILQK